MKALPICLLLMGGAAHAAPVETYLANRDRAIAAANASPPLSDKAEQRARAILERALHDLVPPLNAEGFSAPARGNLETLTHDQGFGRLDALVYRSRDKKTSIVVTTPALLAAWLKARDTGTDNGRALPQDADAALRSEDFYTGAISTDAAVARFATLPVVPPAGAGSAFAMLDRRQQDIASGAPDEITVAVARGNAVYLVTQPASVPPIAACEAVWRAGQAKADAVQSAGGGDKGTEAAETLRGEGDLAFRACFGERFKDQPSYPAILRQAQALVALPR